MNEFEKEVAARLVENGKNIALQKVAYDFMISSIKPKYSNNFNRM